MTAATYSNSARAAADAAMVEIRNGAGASFAIVKAADQYGVDVRDVAGELGHRRKRRRFAPDGVTASKATVDAWWDK